MRSAKEGRTALGKEVWLPDTALTDASAVYIGKRTRLERKRAERHAVWAINAALQKLSPDHR